MPTQTVTIRPWLSNVTDPQSAVKNVEVTVVLGPSGPIPRYVSV
jgi:hypothetical protein